MQFWQAQRKARAYTTLWVVLFIILAVAISLVVELVLRWWFLENYHKQMPYIGFIILGITVVGALGYYLFFKAGGGAAVAKSLGGVEIKDDHPDPRAQKLYNVVAEMSIASAMPMPRVFVIDAEEINAFAAGLSPDTAAVTVTRGAIEQLTRAELQGVVAHEFGHIHNRDMILSMRLAALVMGFFLLFYIGLRMIFFASLTGGGRRGNPALVIALAFLVAGLVTYIGGAILRATVSREREYLADASAVQFTRNPDGLAGALKKIQQSQISDMPKQGIALSHLYFNHRSLAGRLFATHPPIEKRIAVLYARD